MKRPDFIPDPELIIKEQPVRNISNIRVLGITIPKDGSGAQTILPLQRTLTKLMNLNRRVSNQLFGIKETDTLRTIHALLISRVTFGTLYLALEPSEKEN